MEHGIFITWKMFGGLAAFLTLAFTSLFYVLGKVYVPREKVFEEFKNMRLAFAVEQEKKVDVSIFELSYKNIESDIAELKETHKETLREVRDIALTIGKKLNGG